MGDDAIGTLGLDVKPFEAALATVNSEMADLLIESKKLNAEIALLERQMFLAGGGTKAQAKELQQLKTVSEDFTQQIKKAKEEQTAFGQAVEKTSETTQRFGLSVRSIVSLIGAGLGVESLMNLLNQFRKADEAAMKLDDDIRSIGQSDGASEFKTLSALDARIAAINKEVEELTKQKGPLASMIELFRQGFQDMTAERPEDTEGAKRDRQINELLEERKKAEADIAQKVRNQNDVLDLQIKGETELAELKKNQLKFDELIGAAEKSTNTELVAALKLEKEKTDELIKQVDAKKAQKQLDEVMAEEQKDLDFFHKQEGKMAQDAMDNVAKEKQKEMDFFHKQEKKIGDNAIRFAEQEEKKEKARRQRREGLQNQAQVSSTRREDGPIAASREAVAQRYQKQIEDAIRDGDKESEELLRKQQNDDLAKFEVAQNLQTPAQHRAQTRAGLSDKRDEAHAKQRGQDLDDRLARGARGSEHSRLEERRRQNKADAERAQKGEAIRHEEKNGKDANDPFKQATDYLKDIRDSLKDKD